MTGLEGDGRRTVRVSVLGTTTLEVQPPEHTNSHLGVPQQTVWGRRELCKGRGFTYR